VTSSPPSELDIAASYSRRDADAVVPLLDALKARGIRVWFDKDIPGGAVWEEVITRNMRRAKAVVFFVSTDSLASDRCFDEVSAARTLKKPIIPVLIDPVSMPDDLPDRLVLTLQTRNTVDAFPGAPGDPVEALMRALASFGVHGTPAAAPAPDRASTGHVPTQPQTKISARREEPLARATYWPMLILGAVASAALVAAGLWSYGVLGSPSPAAVQITDAEWCGLSAPALLEKAVPSGDFTAMRSAASGGDLDALTLQCLSANRSCTGGDTPVDHAASYAACEQAAGRGRWRALFNQGWLKQRGCGVPVDGPGAVSAYTRSAEAGCAIAQFYLGTLYQDADLVDFDQAASIRWLTAAADQNYPPALNRLGAAYALGRGVPEDDVRAAELYRRAADLGDARAMLNYARCLEQGVGVDANKGAAIAYYRRAAQQSAESEIKQLALDALKRLGADS
jgi:hypothetical protein